MAIDNSNWGYGKPVEGDSQATAPNGAKVQPAILDPSLDEGSTGNGNIGYDPSRIDTTDVNTKLQSIVFTEPDGSTTKPYEVENPEDLGTTNEVVVWIYDQNWATDDTVRRRHRLLKQRHRSKSLEPNRSKRRNGTALERERNRFYSQQ